MTVGDGDARGHRLHERHGGRPVEVARSIYLSIYLSLSLSLCLSLYIYIHIYIYA